VNDWSINNLSMLADYNSKIKQIKQTSDIAKSVIDFWKKGYRHFILDAPTDQIEAVQKLKFKKGIFICPRANNIHIRYTDSPYLFCTTDDHMMIESVISLENKEVKSHLAFVIGKSVDSVFVNELKRKEIACVSIDELDQIKVDTISLYMVGTDQEYEAVFKYITSDLTRFNRLIKFRRYGCYIGKIHQDLLAEFGFVGNFVLNNYSSCQPFLESKYSSISRPTYLSDQTSFLYLSNILLIFSIRFLYSFGYLIDV